MQLKSHQDSLNLEGIHAKQRDSLATQPGGECTVRSLGSSFTQLGLIYVLATPLKQGRPLITPSDEDEAESAEMPPLYFLSFL